MADRGQVATLHRCDIRLLIRHLMGDAASAQDRIGARHRRMTLLYCAGTCDGVAFAGLLRDAEGAATSVWLGTGASPLTAEAWRSVRLRARRQTPDAVWHHPFPLETPEEYAAQEEALTAHLREHARAGEPARSRPAADPRAPGVDFCLHPPPAVTRSSPRWSPDPGEPPQHVRVFPGRIAYRGRAFTITDRERIDPRDERLLVAYHATADASAGPIWLNDQGRIVAVSGTRALRDTSS